MLEKARGPKTGSTSTWWRPVYAAMPLFNAIQHCPHCPHLARWPQHTPCANHQGCRVACSIAGINLGVVPPCWLHLSNRCLVLLRPYQSVTAFSTPGRCHLNDVRYISKTDAANRAASPARENVHQAARQDNRHTHWPAVTVQRRRVLRLEQARALRPSCAAGPADLLNGRHSSVCRVSKLLHNQRELALLAQPQMPELHLQTFPYSSAVHNLPACVLLTPAGDSGRSLPGVESTRRAGPAPSAAANGVGASRTPTAEPPASAGAGLVCAAPASAGLAMPPPPWECSTFCVQWSGMSQPGSMRGTGGDCDFADTPGQQGQ